MSDMHGWHTLSKTGDKVNGVSTTPGSGSTVTLYDSTVQAGGPRGAGARFKMLVINLNSSHDSAATGVTIDESNDGGANWENLSAQSFTYQTASGYVKTFVKVSAPEVRVKYANSANVLTRWRFSILGDSEERGNG